MRITRGARASSTSSKSSSSIPVACLENTLKFTPPRHDVAPRGELVPCETPLVRRDFTGIGSISSIFLTAQPRKRTSFRPRACLQGTGHGFASQILAAYSAMVRSLENLPELAMLRMTLQVHLSGAA